MEIQENNINNQDSTNLEDFKAEMPTTFVKEDIVAPDSINLSGKTLRRNFIYQQRDEYINKHKVAPDERTMEDFANNARRKYIQEGDYSFNKITGEAVWLGTF
ncbi:hypothetical protein BOX09_gp04 [Flavobacterium phage Fpv1]|uniref:Uncharacterized protein n=4 Tax=Fipvunavirus TaxID=2560132 RepID=A0A1B0WKF0_9CAUD|nr:hypothetical protein BOW80_gp03 [Flavobacterium phage Fpv3]YP_009321873.1 hypothetical protein BOW81_gp04 [Flavobacterium phage Fpv20]YP_009322006.1 hypothetical protein BOX09_gp04 [Flavobacterium phage Fpv1]YP_009323595.1 hypothetical protein BOW82_gp04 [Flavobacterium phage Fpv2]YP_009594059.1 hypothetical protein FDG89_gp03 [Flavobacterium phage FpV4]ALN97250.1 hypothetical protein [Flavobacterium phage FpV21]QCW20252.1 hypothetical protein [Flavobacterium phage FPSV-F12]QCW20661.1 hyp